jgi:hypothetical protein
MTLAERQYMAEVSSWHEAVQVLTDEWPFSLGMPRPWAAAMGFSRHTLYAAKLKDKAGTEIVPNGWVRGTPAPPFVDAEAVECVDLPGSSARGQRWPPRVLVALCPVARAELHGGRRVTTA